VAQKPGHNGLISGILARLSHSLGESVERAVVQYFIAIILFAFIALAISRLQLSFAAGGLLFLIVIVLMARVGSFLSSAVVSIASTLWLSYIVPPDYSVRTDNPINAVTVVSFLIVSLIIAWLVSRFREMSEQARSSVKRKLIDADERLRARVGKELHDDIEQRLALLAVQTAQGARSRCLSVSALPPISEQASKIAADVQVLAHELRPYRLEYLGLAPVIKSFCDSFRKQHDMAIEFKCHGLPKDLRLETSVSLIRVLQEALHNSARHSRSHSVLVELFATSDAIHLTIRDSGVGFNPQTALKGPGLGLVSMQERLKLVNGELSIHSLPGKGSTVHACVPLRARPSESRRVAFRLSPPIAVAAAVAILLATTIQIAQVHHSAASQVNVAAAMPGKSGQYMASNQLSAKSRKRSREEKTDTMAPSPAFRQVRISANEVDYLAEDVTVRHFITRPTGTRTGNDAGSLASGKDVTIRYFSSAKAVSPTPSESSATSASKLALPVHSGLVR